MTTPAESARRIPVGVGFAIASAILFGLSTPCAKVLVGEIPPLLLAGRAYFSLAPFFGAAASLVVLRESIGPGFGAAGPLMAFGVWLHLTERHEHEHHHERVEHTHRHPHYPDLHHRHRHG